MNRGVDVENRQVDITLMGAGDGETNWEIRIDINTLACKNR